MGSRKAIACRRVLVVVVPYDPVPELVGRKNFVEYESKIRIDMPIAVHIDATGLRKEIPHQPEPVHHHGDVGVDALPPSVAVCLLLDHRRLLVVTDIGLSDQSREREVRTRGEGWIDVDQVDLARKSFEQRAHHQEIVAPDQLVLPTVLKGVTFVATIGFEETRSLGLAGLARCPTLPDGLDYLERKGDAGSVSALALIIVFPRPDEFGTADVHAHSPFYLRAISEKAGFAKTESPIRRDDHMVHESYAYRLARQGHGASEEPVGLAGLDFAVGMVVSQQNPGSTSA